MTNQDLKAKLILDQYRNRWSIEELFRKLKTSGFHWENTHMTHCRPPSGSITLAADNKLTPNQKTQFRMKCNNSYSQCEGDCGIGT
nr:transposase [Alphaproteobacteria bacterium]